MPNRNPFKAFKDDGITINNMRGIIPRINGKSDININLALDNGYDARATAAKFLGIIPICTTASFGYTTP